MIHTPTKILQKYWGYPSFRPPQDQIIQSILHGKDTLALLPTGGGKSLCYQVPILCTSGLCLVISPLIALMKDQVASLKQKGIKAVLLSSELNYEETQIALDNCKYGGVKLLYVSPERLLSNEFQEKLKQLPIQYIAVDEAHCIAQWGYDFRPAYLQISTITELHPQAPILALTASATPSTQQEIVSNLQFDPHFETYATSLQRKNLAYRMVTSDNKLEDLFYYLKKYPGSCIIFCKSRKATYELSTLLNKQGFDADYFHARLSQEEKNQKQKAWIASDHKILCATNAFGMGIDKPNVRLVMHLHVPQSIEAYFQEVGRAGRDGEEAQGILLYEKEDLSQNIQLFKSNLPSKKQFQEIFSKLYNYYEIAEGEHPTALRGFSLKKLVEKFDLPLKKTKYTLSFLEREGLIKIHENDRQSLVKINLSPQEITDDKNDDAKVLNFLARNYAKIFEQPVPILEDKMARLFQFSGVKVKEILNQLAEIDSIFYRDAAIIKIEFLTPRDDEHLKHVLWRKMNQLESARWTRLQSMHHLILDHQHCKSQLMLRYFGEKKIPKCGKCSNCQPNEYSVQKEVSKEEMLLFLENNEQTLEQIISHFIHSSRENVCAMLQELLDQNLIYSPQPHSYKK